MSAESGRRFSIHHGFHLPLWHDAAKSAVFLGARGEIILDAINRAHQLTSIQYISSPQSSSASRPMRHPFLPNSMPARGIAASNPLTHPSVRPDNSQQDAHRDGIPEWGRHHGTTAPGTGQGDAPRWLLATGLQPMADDDANRQIRWPLSRRLLVLHASLPNLVVSPLLHLAHKVQWQERRPPPRLVREGGESAPREPCTTRQRTRQQAPSHWMTMSAFADVGGCDWPSLTNQWSLSRRLLECWSLTFPKG